MREEKDYRAIGDLRKHLRITQKQVHLDTGISQSLLSKYESGAVKTPSFKHLKAIAESLGLTTDQLDDACAKWQRNHEPFLKILNPKTNTLCIHFVVDRLEDITKGGRSHQALQNMYVKLEEFKTECVYKVYSNAREDHNDEQ